MTPKRPRFPAIKKREDGSNGCRGCGGVIPKNRQTWCSHECHLKFNPFYVKQAVRKRAGDKCEMCSSDLSRSAQHRHQDTMPMPPSYEECGIRPYDFRSLTEHPLYENYLNLKHKWSKLEPKPEYDHIVPHSEGGDFVLENIRFVCAACHRKITACWRLAKSEKRKLLKSSDTNNNVTA